MTPLRNPQERNNTMGQYYATIIRKPNTGKPKVYTANLLKLMEHSWCGNDFTDAITNMLTPVTNAARVWWYGDYTEKDEVQDINFDDIWGDGKRIRNKVPQYAIKSPKVKYLINATKKVYIDLEEYAKASTDANGELIYPLAILTCTSNGRGGGDFYPTKDSTADLVGAWAGDTVYFSIAAPEGYEKVCPIFKE